MSDEAPPKKEEGGGAPAWVMTFADLMSLLMCFFVLLLSFAEMDLLKFKQIAGSMKMAFGVQRDIKVKEMPKGTSVIAREFSPGKPTPTPVAEVRQQTIDETKQTLEFTDATSDKDELKPSESKDDIERAPIQRQPDSLTPNDIQLETELQALSDMVSTMQQEMAEIIEEVAEKLSEEEQQALDEAQANLEQIDAKVDEIIALEETLEPREVIVEPDYEQTNEDAEKLLQALAPEIRKGLVSIETENNKIILRIKEKGSFPSGSSTMEGGFLPVINKLKTALHGINGKIIVSGHTDNIPIKTARFRSNWELSSSRAVTVVHELLKNSRIKQARFTVEGHGAAKPLAPNDSAANRALNRRVELLIIQNDGDEIEGITAEDAIGETVEQTPPEEDKQLNEIIDTSGLKTKLETISDSLQ